MNEYKIFLENKLIGTTKFEFADIPMGVLYGKINHIEIDNPYLFFKQHCENNQIEYSIIEDEKYINTLIIKNIKVYDKENNELIANFSVNGFDKDFQIDAYNIEEKIMKTQFLSHYYNYYDTTE